MLGCLLMLIWHCKDAKATTVCGSQCQLHPAQMASEEVRAWVPQARLTATWRALFLLQGHFTLIQHFHWLYTTDELKNIFPWTPFRLIQKECLPLLPILAQVWSWLRMTSSKKPKLVYMWDHVPYNHPGKKAKAIQVDKEMKIQGKDWKHESRTSKGSGHVAWRGRD